MANFDVKDGFKYLVVETGYTGRLVEKIPMIKEDMKEIEKGDCETDPKECTRCNDLVLFIEDHLWGEGLYTVSSKTEEIEEIRKLLEPKWGLYQGFIVLRCDRLGKAMNVARALMEHEHCGCFNFDNLYQITVIPGEILVMRFDCESG